MPLIQASKNALLEQTEMELFHRGPRLRFAQPLESRYQSDRDAIRNRQSATAAFAALIIYEILIAALILGGGIKGNMISSYLLLTQTAFALPTLLFSVLAYLNVLGPVSRELYVSAIYLSLCSIPLTYGFYLAPEYALGTYFSDVLVIVGCNIAMPLSFRYASAATMGGTTLLTIALFHNLGENTDLAISLSETFIAAALLTLIANYRSESADRRNYLLMLRESIHNKTTKEINRQLEQLSFTDPLTGLANRRKFDDAMTDAVVLAQTEKSPLSLLMFDLDYFKAYNDHYGHPAGDSCLQDIARYLRHYAGKGTLARIGGEEFALLLPDTGNDDALKTAELLRREVQALAIPHQGRDPGSVVTLSIGVTTAENQETINAEQLVWQADQALYGSKRAGRNTVTAYQDVSSTITRLADVARVRT